MAAGCSPREEWHRRTAAFDPHRCTAEKHHRRIVAFQRPPAVQLWQEVHR